ncbi:ImmA/IrrE family metallo-endopeptidase [Xenorhabdus siamensis]|uniref:ImmA/IrrE family metallo-endopeptidase n=1 Tax=Xenorhabdus siamensis TaxID=3136254 RepID=UPI0030F4548D
MATIELQLSPKIIEWIANKQGVSTQHLAEEFTPKKPQKFLSGIVSKTIAEKLAKHAGIPFGYLFLETPPVMEPIEVPDFRRSLNYAELSKNFTDTYKDILFKIEWYKDYLQDVGADVALPFVSKYTIHDNTDTVSDDIVKTIKFDIQKIIRKVRNDSYFSVVSKLVEDSGILVFKNGVVGNSTRRKLNIEEFRGFSVVDSIAPAVFINGADSFSAQVFTLFHEVAHIWIGQGGVSDWDYENKIEAFCNKVAANILMPTNLFIHQWNNEKENFNDVTYVNKYVAKFFRISEYACAIKAKDLKLISNEAFSQIKKECISRADLNQKSSNGGSSYNTIPYRNSNKVTDAVLYQTMSQKLPLREAGRVLNISADTVIELYKKRTSR